MKSLAVLAVFAAFFAAIWFGWPDDQTRSPEHAPDGFTRMLTGKVVEVHYDDDDAPMPSVTELYDTITALQIAARRALGEATPEQYAAYVETYGESEWLVLFGTPKPN